MSIYRYTMIHTWWYYMYIHIYLVLCYQVIFITYIVIFIVSIIHTYIYIYIWLYIYIHIYILYIFIWIYFYRHIRSPEAAEMLADASIVPAFIRLCGAKMGPGCVMGLQARGEGAQGARLRAVKGWTFGNIMVTNGGWLGWLDGHGFWCFCSPCLEPW